METFRTLRSSRQVFASVLGVAALLIAALSVLSFRLLEQERTLGVQRMRERLEQALDRVNAGLLNNLTAESDQLASLLHAAPAQLADKATEAAAKSSGSLLLLFTPETVTSYPAHRLLYTPVADVAPDRPRGSFAESDAAEFRSADFGKAASLLLPLTQSANATLRCAALLRLSRVQRKSGNIEAALTTYRQLEQCGTATVDGLPAELVARHARLELLSARNPSSAVQQEAQALAADLREAQWPLARGEYLFYSAEARRLGAVTSVDDPQAVVFAEGAAALWKQWQDIRRGESLPSGHRNLRVNNQPMVLIWSSSAERLAGRVVNAGYIANRWMGSASSGEYVRVGISGPEDFAILPLPATAGSFRVARTITNSQLQWTFHAASTNSQADFAQMSSGRNLLFGGLALVILLAMGGSYAIARAINRELQVARLQSDFVAAVSHEFRTPLTTLQQLSEMLARGRVPTEERRQRYYDVMSGETTRLNRLVEDLLDFGRMEAGAQVYHPKAIAVGSFLKGLVGDFRAQAECRGYQIILNLDEADGSVDADPEALRRAVWNLLDNAVKYSPDADTVWVEAKRQNRQFSISVRDRGMGIAAADQRRIFQKFMRGSAAKTASIQGTGLGLAMVRHIVKAHHGEILVESEPGNGSAFTILLPVSDGGLAVNEAGSIANSESV